MDSRLYVFIFAVNTPADIPSDFQASVNDRGFEAGVFLPQDDSSWFTEPPKYPARLLLLNGDCLYIIPHPTSKQQAAELNIRELVELETGNSLLSGWIQLITRSSNKRLIYNTRASRPLDKFLTLLRRRWLGEPTATNTNLPKSFGREPDIKFRNMLSDALDLNEAVVSQCFSPPIEYQEKLLVFRRVQWRSGHLVALTSGNRLLWLKDEYRGQRELYAGIAVSVPTSLVLCSAVESTPDHEELVIHFSRGISWRISMYETQCECGGFSRTLNACFAPKLVNGAGSNSDSVRPQAIRG